MLFWVERRSRFTWYWLPTPSFSSSSFPSPHPSPGSPSKKRLDRGNPGGTSRHLAPWFLCLLGGRSSS